MTLKERIIRYLIFVNKPIAVHEFGWQDVSQNNLATRLSELAAEKKVESKYRDGKAYKEWFVPRYEKTGQKILL